MSGDDSLWEPAPEFIQTLHDEVHVWRASLSLAPSYLQSLGSILSADERQRADRFRFQRDRRDFIAARALLRILLGRYLRREPPQLQFDYSPSGKPRLVEGEAAPVRFNLSHSHGLALYAFSCGREIGVDVEHVGRHADVEQIAERFFSSQEIAVLRSLPRQERQRAFFACWTRKEAYVKARGDGLSRSLDSFSVSLSPGEPAALLNVADDPGEASRWSLLELDPGPGFVAALAVEGGNWRVKCWQWREAA